MCDSTKVLEMCTDDLSVLSYMAEENGYMQFVKLDGENCFDHRLKAYGVKFSMDSDRFKDGHEQLLEDVKRERFLIFDNACQRAFWPSRSLMRTMSQILKIQGDFFFEPGFARNIVLAKEFEKGQSINLIVRMSKNLSNKCEYKIYGIAGKYYRPESKNLIPDLIEMFTGFYGKMSACTWKITESKASIFFELKKLSQLKQGMKDIKVGIKMQTSNIMESAFFCRLVMKIKDTEIPIYTICKKHTSPIQPDQIFTEMKKHVDICLNESLKKMQEECITFPRIIALSKKKKIYNFFGKKKLAYLFCDMYEENKYLYIRNAIRKVKKLDLNEKDFAKFEELLGCIIMEG